MKIRFRNIMILLVLFVGGSSCDSFLDVQPKGEVLEGDLLKDAKGFENALYGVYAKMGTAGLYGQNLSYYALDLQIMKRQSRSYSMIIKVRKWKIVSIISGAKCIPISHTRITCWNIWNIFLLRICNFIIFIKERL